MGAKNINSLSGDTSDIQYILRKTEEGDASWYCWGSIDPEIPDYLTLLDTGAQVCAISKETYDSFPDRIKATRKPADRLLAGPGREELVVYGAIDLIIYIEDIPICARFWVIDTAEPVILSLKTMQYHGFSFDLGRRKVFLRNKSVRVFDKHGRRLSTKVIAPKDYYVPPKGECVLNGRTKKLPEFTRNVVVLEPSKKIFAQSGVMIARIALSANCTDIPVRVFNPMSETMIIKKNSVMGVLMEGVETQHFSPEINTSTDKKSRDESKPTDESPQAADGYETTPARSVGKVNIERGFYDPHGGNSPHDIQYKAEDSESFRAASHSCVNKHIPEQGAKGREVKFMDENSCTRMGRDATTNHIAAVRAINS